MRITSGRDKNTSNCSHLVMTNDGTSVAQVPAAMLKTSSLLYVALLLLAFAVGLLGTLAASKAVTQSKPRGPHRIERPASGPGAPEARLPTTSC
jgi:hypothetical protein